MEFLIGRRACWAVLVSVTILEDDTRVTIITHNSAYLFKFETDVGDDR